MNWFGKLLRPCKAETIPDDPPAERPPVPPGPPSGRIHRHEYGVIDTTPMCSPASFKLNAERSVAVATDYFWNEDMADCPRGVKVQLLGRGGVAVYGSYSGSDFWTAWAPCPKRR